MQRIAQVAVLLALVEKLHENHSWCGETHIQKAAFFLKDMLHAELDYDFMLYKHGPYSFDLNDELGRLRAEGLVTVVPKDPYGPSILPGGNWHYLKDKFPKALARHAEKIDFVGRWLGGKKVAELERLATAWFVTKENPNLSLKNRSEKIVEIKPHISPEEAEEALREVDAKSREAEQIAA